MPITSASAVDCKGGLANNIQLQLYKPLYYNDTLKLQIRTGNDGNTLLNGCGFQLAKDTLTLVVKNCAGNVALRETESPSFNFYPNPAGDYIWLEFEDNQRRVVEILDAQGRLILSTEIDSDKYYYDVSTLDGGIYLIRTTTGEERTVSRLIKN